MRVHFVGIGGIGMSALARYFLAGGWEVSGSDLVDRPVMKEMRKEGMKIFVGHKKSFIPKGTVLIIYNRAIPVTNIERVAARERKILTLPYAEALGKLTERYVTVAITGSHGKSTTTAMTALALVRSGLDPTVLVGTLLREFGGRNIRIGKGPFLVLEADDYGGAILDYSPSIAVVTNIDREHVDFYKTFENLKTAFLEFLDNTREGGVFILNRDDAVLRSLRVKIAAIAKRNNIRVVWYSTRDASAKKIRRAIGIPGAHNVSNALAALAVAKFLHVPETKALSAVHAYRGAWRRMEHKGTATIGRARAEIYDDYAHHPTEIKATLQAFREKYPRSPLVCVYEPHQAKRLVSLFKEFKEAFDEADIVVILPLYKVEGRDEKIVRTSEDLAHAMQERKPNRSIFYLADPKRIKLFLQDLFKRPAARSARPVVIMMGAGDIADRTKSILK